MTELMPNWEDIEFKDKFIERYEQLTNWEQFKQASLTFLRRSVRVNTLKTNVDDMAARFKNSEWKLDPIPWCKEGFWINNPQRRDVGNLFEHHVGYLYVQEAASMIPPLVLGAKPDEVVLDMAAAPGSKTTQIAAMMNNTGLLVANDYKGMRLKPLGMNIQRVGATNVVISLMMGQRFKGFSFDRVLIDAPCSGTGTIAKSLKTLRIWNPGMVTRLCEIQKSLIYKAFENLTSGGTMVYSTCTMEPQEDEGVIDALLRKFDNSSIDKIKDSELPGLNKSKPVTSFNDDDYTSEVSKALRIWPQDNMTEGFFVCRIKKD